MGFFSRISEGLARSREKFTEQMNVLLDRGPDLDEEFWDGLEETLILADIGGAAASDIVEGLRDTATRKALPDAYAVLDLLNDRMASAFSAGGEAVFGGDPACVLFVGINGAGKDHDGRQAGQRSHGCGAHGPARQRRHVSRRGHRAARGMGAPRRCGDLHARTGKRPCQRVLRHDRARRAEKRRPGARSTRRAVCIRLADLMRELEKVVNVVRKRRSFLSTRCS